MIRRLELIETALTWAMGNCTGDFSTAVQFATFYADVAEVYPLGDGNLEEVWERRQWMN